jgi:hypothetical protein
MTTRRIALLGLPAALAACAAQPLPPADPSVSLPRDAVAGAGDPTRSAIISTAYGFGQAPAYGGNPAEAARGIANAEYLANAVITDPRYSRNGSLVAVQFAQARPEWRAAAGINPNAPAQPIIEALYAYSRAPGTPLLGALFSADTPQRLAALGPLPNTASATAAASRLLIDLDNQRGPGGGGGRRL